MTRSNGHRRNGHRPDYQSAGLRAALVLLLEEHDHARRVHLTPEDFPLPARTLTAVGLAANELRMLVLKGYVACQTGAGIGRRPLRLSSTTKLVLTPAGVAFARGACSSQARYGRRKQRARLEAPCYDFLLRTLTARRRIVKELRRDAPDQEAVLGAFQRQGWPGRIADPLPEEPGQDPQQHLHDTLKNLNRHQRHRLIRFRGDGTGHGVRWESVRRNGTGKTKRRGIPDTGNHRAEPQEQANGAARRDD